MKEAIMEWLNSNWIWLVVGVGALAFFAFGGGGCGMSHRGHGRRPESDDRPPETIAPEADGRAPLAAEQASGASQVGRRRHRHGC